MRYRFNAQTEQTVGAVILAGGLARRMGGQDKGLVQLAGKPMVQYALDTLSPLVDKLVINANRNLAVYRNLGVDVVEDDLQGHQGPLAGLSAGIKALHTDYVCMCPCDSPFLHRDLFVDLLDTCIAENSDVAVPHDGQRLQPVFCVVHRRVLTTLDEFLASGERKIDKWFMQNKLSTIDAAGFSDSFRNINTEQELLSAEAELMT